MFIRKYLDNMNKMLLQNIRVAFKFPFMHFMLLKTASLIN